MTTHHVRVLVEATARKRVFGCSALDFWPGLARSGRDEAAALEALLTALPRYAAAIPPSTGLAFDADNATLRWSSVPRGRCVAPRSACQPWWPTRTAEPVDAADGARLAAARTAAWATLSTRVAAAAPEELRKGPRGGGRDPTKVLAHVLEAPRAPTRCRPREHEGRDAVPAPAASPCSSSSASPSDGDP